MAPGDAFETCGMEIDPAQVIDFQAHGVCLIDVRDAGERASGTAPGALGMPMADLARDIVKRVPDVSSPLILLCASGRRSLAARESLLALGYRKVVSVRGGFNRWRNEALPVEYGELDADSAERYARHLVLPEVGIAGQKKLSAARIALIGAGGLGSPAALYLAAAGVGTLRVIDDDRVERSNLQRQVLHSEARVGMNKAESARLTLGALNPGVCIETFETRLQASNALELVEGSDLVIDGADNFPTRYLLNSVSRRLNLPLVYGAVHRFSGQVSVFDPRDPASPCYRCLFPQPPDASDAPNCSEAGVLGVLPGIIGLLQATEALKLLLGIGQPLIGRLLCQDALTARFHELGLPRDPQCPGCGPAAAAGPLTDLEQLCSAVRVRDP